VQQAPGYADAWRGRARGDVLVLYPDSESCSMAPELTTVGEPKNPLLSSGLQTKLIGINQSVCLEGDWNAPRSNSVGGATGPES
jgi:hypothetical protein